MNREKIKTYLDNKYREYNQSLFIQTDPISIPHLFNKKQDIEIAAFFAAIFAWGNRTTIINKGKELMKLMNDRPYDFILNHKRSDLEKLFEFRHRTFNSTDLLYFIEFLHYHYREHDSLENAFVRHMKKTDLTIENALNGFYQYFFSLDAVPARTRKHIASPQFGSTCKRLNMFLRWMVRKDRNAVDFGHWKKIKSSQLVIPVDLHVARVARRLGLLQRKQVDWKAALEITAHLRTFDDNDPVKYDYALFGISAMERL